MTPHKMRRFRQALSDEENFDILHRGKVAVWAVDGDEDYPYAVPVNYVFHAGAILIHCASQGHKIDAILRNPKCSICVIDKDDVIPEKFTSYFRSVIAFGQAEILTDRQEKIDALLRLSAKYSPGIDPTHEIDRFINVVCIVRITLESITGKQAIELLNAN